MSAGDTGAPPKMGGQGYVPISTSLHKIPEDRWLRCQCRTCVECEGPQAAGQGIEASGQVSAAINTGGIASFCLSIHLFPIYGDAVNINLLRGEED